MFTREVDVGHCLTLIDFGEGDNAGKFGMRVAGDGRVEDVDSLEQRIQYNSAVCEKLSIKFSRIVPPPPPALVGTSLKDSCTSIVAVNSRIRCRVCAQEVVKQLPMLRICYRRGFVERSQWSGVGTPGSGTSRTVRQPLH